MTAVTAFESIRPVVEAMADLMCCHGFSPEEDGTIRAHLMARGFDLELIRKAEDWCEASQASGSIVDLLSIFIPSVTGVRLTNPLERVAVSDQVLDAVVKCRDRGIISGDMVERLLEGTRALDTRDWDDEEVRAFFVDACSANASRMVQMRLERALHGDFRDYYS
jgi:hypothetical protein